ncbi:MAG: hypothetical protein JST26_14960 [Bacteroidetes bacterium]|nr:hypothetical protein [Bacteroidota bacterium]
MKALKSIRFMLSLVLVIAIGFMEYSIIDDSFSAVHVSAQEVIKKEKKSHDLVIARNMQMDDDDEVAIIKYTPHEFYHCDLMFQLRFILSAAPVQMVVNSSDPITADLPIYHLACTYRI